MTNERQVLELIAVDRLEIPLSSIEQKLRKQRSAIASDVAQSLGEVRFRGERTYAFAESEDKDRARGMKEAIAEFTVEFPKYGAILRGKIAEKRTKREEHLYFGVNPGCKLTADDYLTVMGSLGISEANARSLYPALMDVSRKLSKARNEDRSIIVGRYED